MNCTKKKPFNIVIFFFIIIGSSIIFEIQFQTDISSKITSGEQNDKTTDLTIVKTSETILDKVYTFESPNYQLIFGEYDLDDEYNYIVHVELVSPHNITILRIEVTDPEDDVYVIFEDFMCYNPESGRIFNIPFGVGAEHDHMFVFKSTSDFTFNLYISIKKETKCLYDIMNQEEINNIHFYRVCKISRIGETYLESSIYLNSDIMYTMYFARVSAIAYTISSIVTLTYIIEDPQSRQFIIYNSETMEDVYDVKKFDFGTAEQGNYILKITVVPQQADFINVAYSISKKYEISNNLEGNETNDNQQDHLFGIGEDDKKNDENINVPIDLYVGTFIFLAIIVVGVVSVVYIYKKKNNSRSYLKEEKKKSKN